MTKKNPQPYGAGSISHRADADRTPRRKTLKLQYKCDVPAIHIRKDGPLFRVQIVPPIQLDGSIARTESYAGPIAARQAAGWLSKATGFEIVDLLAVQP